MVIYKLTYEPLAQVKGSGEQKWGKSGVGFTMIKIDAFQEFSLKSYAMVI